MWSMKKRGKSWIGSPTEDRGDHIVKTTPQRPHYEDHTVETTPWRPCHRDHTTETTPWRLQLLTGVCVCVCEGYLVNIPQEVASVPGPENRYLAVF